ncbi:Peptidyl-tRNA hydrolase [Pseudovibrio axinellae]|uniref:Peptidyl-tRNA hydrolase n=1 Tax=Pseudovibrio axinellae TaxID=989403 RepID=A0A165XUG4_9HYPH|nr:aminoacyl-tRNA hydrolase [Pseudovibrio axinellae]KZL18054.1 Peptidyl-tRNA hydrolase [Pseudovibrio axinellae]SER12022.1 peptidyl-tRNA hydrolase [Pseudovibrio axinellae]
MKLLVGLGNPGPKYEKHRHNIGFMAADEIHRRHSSFGPWRARFQAQVSEGNLAGEKVLLMKPMTYVNESGRSVGEALRFFKIDPQDVVVLYDELDLPAAKFRMKNGGGNGGHNGLRSITAHITDGYRRLRLGIGHPGHKDRVHQWVLGDFAKVDQEWLSPLLEAIADNAPLLAQNNDNQFANKVTLATRPSGAVKPYKKDSSREAAAKKQQDKAKPETEKKPAPKAVGYQDKEANKKGPLAAALEQLLGSKGQD